MKFITKTMAIVALLAIGSINAKQIGKKTAITTRTTTPTREVITPTQTTILPDRIDLYVDSSTDDYYKKINLYVGSLIDNYKKNAMQNINDTLRKRLKNLQIFSDKFFNVIMNPMLSTEDKIFLLTYHSSALQNALSLPKSQETIDLEKQIETVINNFVDKYRETIQHLEKIQIEEEKREYEKEQSSHKKRSF